MDGVLDLRRNREMIPGQPEEFLIKPPSLAETAFQLSGHDSSAWSLAVEAQPGAESR